MGGGEVGGSPGGVIVAPGLPRLKATPATRGFAALGLDPRDRDTV